MTLTDFNYILPQFFYIRSQKMTNMQVPPEMIEAIKSKYEEIKLKGCFRLNLSHQLKSTDTKAFDEMRNSFMDALSQEQIGQALVQKYKILILGCLEGTSAEKQAVDILCKRFGQNVQKINFENFLKQKIKLTYYGGSGKKQNSIRQIKDSKALDSLQQLYDVKQIKEYRKFCNNYKNLIKSTKKFIESYEKTQNEINQMSDAYMNYITFIKEETIVTKNNIIFKNKEFIQKQLEPKIVLNETKPLSQIETDNLTPKKSSQLEREKSTISKQKSQQNQKSLKKTKITKEEKEKLKEQKQRVKQERQKIKQEKQLIRLEKLEQKQRQKQQKQAQRKAKEEERLKQKETKQLQRKQKQQERLRQKECKQKERLEKQTQRKAKQLQKEKKKAPGRNLFSFFIKNKNNDQSQSKQKQQNVDKNQEESKTDYNQKADLLIKMMNQKQIPLSELRKEHEDTKMKEQNPQFQEYYTSIVIRNSRLEFENYYINQKYFSKYTNPHYQFDEGKYDDSSVEYEELCGDICNEEQEQIVEDEGENESANSAIVPDGYLSGDEISSNEDSKENIEIDISKGGQWSKINKSQNDEKLAKYKMIYLCDQQFPLVLREEVQQTGSVNFEQKCLLYKQIHGYYGSKDCLIKKLSQISENLSKNYIHTFIREVSTKKIHQRLLRPELIEELNQQIQGISIQLTQIKKSRDEEMKLFIKEKQSEKQRQIEYLILNYEGSYYILDLLTFLKENGVKMRKKELTAFIQQRVGPQWQQIRKKVKKMLNNQKKTLPEIFNKNTKIQNKQE